MLLTHAFERRPLCRGEVVCNCVVFETETKIIPPAPGYVLQYLVILGHFSTRPLHRAPSL